MEESYTYLMELRFNKLPKLKSTKFVFKMLKYFNLSYLAEAGVLGSSNFFSGSKASGGSIDSHSSLDTTSKGSKMLNACRNPSASNSRTFSASLNVIESFWGLLQKNTIKNQYNRKIKLRF